VLWGNEGQLDKLTWYQKKAVEVGELLNSNLETGLTEAAVTEKRAQYGLNELTEQQGKTVWSMFIEQFKDFLVILLFVAAIISGVLGEWLDAGVILVIVALNAFLGVFQEYKAEKSLAALKKLAAPKAKVLRDSQVKEIAAQDLVPGDVIVLEAGDFVPADALLFEVANLKVEESALTGESVPVDKEVATYNEEIPLADRKNMVYMGTIVTYGRGKAIVVNTGMQTEIGQIATMIQQVEPESTPLQQKLEEFGKQLGILALIVCALIFVVGLIRGEKLIEIFMISVSLAVAAIPEGLPAIVTIVLALGVQRMAKQRAIIRKLPAVETLGAATIICSDKTGTLTQNQMTVRQIYTADQIYEVTGLGYQPEGDFVLAGKPVLPDSDANLSFTLLCGALCNDSNLDKEEAEGKEQWKIIGDPTEGALMVVAAKAGIARKDVNRDYPRVKEIPFDSDRKLMTTLHKGSFKFAALKSVEAEQPDGLWVITKGAPDNVLKRCRSYLGATGVEKLTEERRNEFLKQNELMGKEALRVLGVAIRRVAADFQLEQVEDDLIFVGFWGMIDPPRLEVKDSIAECRNAGITPVLITGDHQITAAAIAGELGLLAEGQKVISGQELDRLSDQELREQVEQIAVYARVSPEHKVRIVDAFRSKEHIVAMTGDGVNDAPALKRADIGAAMGITGTDVAKSAAEMVLADDNFATIVGAVREGRIIFENIKKSVYFLLSCNIGEIVAILLAILFQIPVPLIAIQILWVNLVTDSLPALALGMEPAEPGIMQRKPRRKEEGIFAPGMKLSIFAEGIVIGAITLIAFYLGYSTDQELAAKIVAGFGFAVNNPSLAIGRTMAFGALSLSQLFHVFNFRSVRNSIFRSGMKQNYFLIGAALISGLIQVAVMTIPFFQNIFKAAPLAVQHWLIVIGLAVSTIPLVELWKGLVLRKFFK